MVVEDGASGLRPRGSVRVGFWEVEFEWECTRGIEY